MPFDLFPKVFEHSVEKTDWLIAAREWTVLSLNRVESDSTCICGKKHILYVSTIQNLITGEQLYPIGSECIKKFKNPFMDNELKRLKKEEKKLKKLASTQVGIGMYNELTIEECCNLHSDYVKFVYEKHLNSKYNSLLTYAKLKGIV